MDGRGKRDQVLLRLQVHWLKEVRWALAQGIWARAGSADPPTRIWYSAAMFSIRSRMPTFLPQLSSSSAKEGG